MRKVVFSFCISYTHLVTLSLYQHLLTNIRAAYSTVLSEKTHMKTNSNGAYYCSWYLA